MLNEVAVVDILVLLPDLREKIFYLLPCFLLRNALIALRELPICGEFLFSRCCQNSSALDF